MSFQFPGAATARDISLSLLCSTLSFFNLPKFFELTTSCPEPEDTQYSDLNNTSFHDYNLSFPLPDQNQSLTSLPQLDNFLGQCQFGDLELIARDMRINYWYLNIYVLWMNTILNILFPIISLIVLNIIICR